MPVSRKTLERLRVVGDTPAIDAAARADGVELVANPGSRTEPRQALVPYWTSECGRAVVYVGDCREVMAAMEPEQFHAVVTDPPYGLEFMGREWDAPWKGSGGGSTDARDRRADEIRDPSKGPYIRSGTTYGLSNPQGFQAWFLNCAKAMLHVAKVGAHLLSFGGTRMWHRMVCAVEDAGFEIRDTLMWVYGSGFPKSHNVGKAIDKMFGAERTEILGLGQAPIAQGQFNSRDMGSGGYGYEAEYNITAPVTEAAKRWDGWGTCLKPAYEPIVLARKPMRGTVAQCVLDNGTGALNVDACRVGTEGGTTKIDLTPGKPGSVYNGTLDGTFTGPAGVPNGKGRWPANLLHDGSEEVVELFLETGSTKPDTRSGGVMDETEESWRFKRTPSALADQGGSAARFFYTAKADHTDRPHGKEATTHPTVKPLDLMRYLVRLVAAQGSTVLDPFMGSGSTGCAAVEEGMWFVGIEQSQEYADIAIGRLKLSLEKCPSSTRLETGQKVEVKVDTPPPPRRLRG